MKSFAVSTTFFALFCAAAPAEEAQTNSAAPPVAIRAAEARNHTNAMAVVTGKIVEVNRTARMVYLNFEKPFPNQPFAAVVFAAKTNLFPNAEQLKGKNVEVTGKIVDYRNHPEIVLESTNQLKVVEKTAEPAKDEKPTEPAAAK
jgi:hypothetical protein